MVMPKKQRARKKLRRSKTTKPATSSSRLAELAEVQEILLPELAARIAAIEHLLIEKGLCSYNDLKQAREFIKIQESS
jgi:Holliday junction resolvasome RuvABC endonuclease subunit